MENASHRESTQMDAESVTQRTVKSKKETLAKIELSPPSTWKDLDKLITLLQSQAEDDGYFIYLKPSPFENNPYDLQPLVDI